MEQFSLEERIKITMEFSGLSTDMTVVNVNSTYNQIAIMQSLMRIEEQNAKILEQLNGMVVCKKCGGCGKIAIYGQAEPYNVECDFCNGTGKI